VAAIRVEALEQRMEADAESFEPEEPETPVESEVPVEPEAPVEPDEPLEPVVPLEPAAPPAEPSEVELAGSA
jgi:hypothetical protein